MKKKLFLISLLLVSCTSLHNSFVNKSIEFLNTVNVDKDSTLKMVSYLSKYEATENDYTRIRYLDVKIEKFSKKQNDKVIYFVHGGAFYYPLTNVYRNLARKIIDKYTDYDVVFVNYDTLPDSFYPKANKQVDIAMNYVLERYKKVYGMGDSAGGNLIVSALLKRRDEGRKMIDKLILFSPFLDISNTVNSRYENIKSDRLIGSHLDEYKLPKLLYKNEYFKYEKNLKHPYISPVFADFHNFPPTYIEIVEGEMLTNDSTIIKEKLEKENIKVKFSAVKDLYHVYILNIYSDDSDKAIEKVFKFIEEE